jgi:hypothetical protein
MAGMVPSRVAPVGAQGRLGRPEDLDGGELDGEGVGGDLVLGADHLEGVDDPNQGPRGIEDGGEVHHVAHLNGDGEGIGVAESARAGDPDLGATRTDAADGAIDARHRVAAGVAQARGDVQRGGVELEGLGARLELHHHRVVAAGPESQHRSESAERDQRTQAKGATHVRSLAEPCIARKNGDALFAHDARRNTAGAEERCASWRDLI